MGLPRLSLTVDNAVTIEVPGVIRVHSYHILHTDACGLNAWCMGLHFRFFARRRPNMAVQQA